MVPSSYFSQFVGFTEVVNFLWKNLFLQLKKRIFQVFLKNILQHCKNITINQFFKHILIFLHQYNSYIWTRLNQIWTYDLMEQIGIIHGCITPLQYKVGQFTLECLGLGSPNTKISPLCHIHFTSLPRSLGQVTKSTLLNSSQFRLTNATLPTSHQVHFLFLIAKILFKLPEAEYCTNCSMGEMYSLAAQTSAPKNKRLPNFRWIGSLIPGPKCHRYTCPILVISGSVFRFGVRLDGKREAVGVQRLRSLRGFCFVHVVCFRVVVRVLSRLVNPTAYLAFAPYRYLLLTGSPQLFFFFGWCFVF